MNTDYSHLELDNVAALMEKSEIFEYEPLEPPAVEPFNENHHYSQVIINMTKKVGRLMEEEERQKSSPIDEDAEERKSSPIDENAEDPINEQLEDEQMEDEEEARPASALDVKDSKAKKDDDWFQEFPY
jgi:hypothetical protein